MKKDVAYWQFEIKEEKRKKAEEDKQKLWTRMLKVVLPCFEYSSEIAQ